MVHLQYAFTGLVLLRVVRHELLPGSQRVDQFRIILVSLEKKTVEDRQEKDGEEKEEDGGRVRGG